MNRPFIIAEVGANHLGELARAQAMIDAAAAAGADAVKFQTYTPEQMVDEQLIIESGPWAGRRALDLYREAATPRNWHGMLYQRVRDHGMVAFSSVFHPDDVDFLEQLDCPIYKIASFELLDVPLIRKAVGTGKPIMMSTGMASQQEIFAAVTEAVDAGADYRDITLLRCTSAYPADASEARLATLDDMREQCFCEAGLSDHTPGIGVAVAATALGATVIEKHLTLRRADGGPDAAFSMEPDEFAQLVIECRRAAAAIGEVRYGPTPAEASSLLLRRPPGGKRGDKA